MFRKKGGSSPIGQWAPSGELIVKFRWVKCPRVPVPANFANCPFHIKPVCTSRMKIYYGWAWEVKLII